jgi:ribonucleoside-diphosphate reductase alpha chain
MLKETTTKKSLLHQFKFYYEKSKIEYKEVLNLFKKRRLLLSDNEKDIFKTAIEINQQWIIEHAADRQEFICQGQSLNVFVPADVNIKELHDIHMLAWKRKLKTLYYCRSEAIKRAELVSLKVERTIIPEADCLACEG